MKTWPEHAVLVQHFSHIMPRSLQPRAQGLRPPPGQVGEESRRCHFKQHVMGSALPSPGHPTRNVLSLAPEDNLTYSEMHGHKVYSSLSFERLLFLSIYVQLKQL